ncbi:MAG: hypothetical protein HSCHL_2491 [Hydrogenibacillus schlegelii]|uniref:Uncharacterized protein n=2 Tax=Bacillales incertae sedis TaxID=539002 RepID=A0A2T5G3U4_HYDSH|nr:MAG: hypothetical protein HSCHL_2491 [Hydrogenibacillus schlegelii]PTQ55339.1 MAG: hypothetical protein BSOLF_2425 [Candidatus Carbobacillus altaicus]
MYTAPRLLIIDEPGDLALDSLEATLFFQLVSAWWVPLNPGPGDFSSGQNGGIFKSALTRRQNSFLFCLK